MEKKYKKLVSNTVLFALSKFPSKFLFFIMAPLFSYWFETQEMAGIRDLLNQFANFTIPMVSLGIAHAVIRFGIDDKIDKKQVYSSGIMAVCGGFLILVCISPILANISWYTDYIALLCVYVLVSCMRTLNCQFVRAKQHIRLYAVDGILCTVVTCVLYFVFLSALNMGPTGYLLAVIFADGFSALFMFFMARLWRYISFRGNLPLLKQMLRYSLPLVPASIFWWVTNASDQMFVAALLPNGEAQTAIYANSYKLPTVLTIVCTVFTEAWQISAFTDGDDNKGSEFFTRVFSTFQGILFFCGSFFILMAQPFMMLFRDDYFIGWTYIPFLVIATVFSAFSGFLNSVYMLKKRSGVSLWTMAVGAGLNIVLNLVLIPLMGVQGAIVATFVSYLTVFVLRVITTRPLVLIDFNPKKIVLNLVLLTTQALIMLFNVPFWPVISSLIFVFVFIINMREILMTVMKLLKKARAKGKEETT